MAKNILEAITIQDDDKAARLVELFCARSGFTGVNKKAHIREKVIEFLRTTALQGKARMQHQANEDEVSNSNIEMS